MHTTTVQPPKQPALRIRRARHRARHGRDRKRLLRRNRRPPPRGPDDTRPRAAVLRRRQRQPCKPTDPLPPEPDRARQRALSLRPLRRRRRPKMPGCVHDAPGLGQLMAEPPRLLSVCSDVMAPAASASFTVDSELEPPSRLQWGAGADGVGRRPVRPETGVVLGGGDDAQGRVATLERNPDHGCQTVAGSTVRGDHADETSRLASASVLQRRELVCASEQRRDYRASRGRGSASFPRRALDPQRSVQGGERPEGRGRPISSPDAACRVVHEGATVSPMSPLEPGRSSMRRSFAKPKALISDHLVI